jgi:hypothetical protein
MRWAFIRGLFSKDVTQLYKVEWQDDNECGIGIGVSVALAQLKVMSQHFLREPEENYEEPQNVLFQQRFEPSTASVSLLSPKCCRIAL